MHPQIRGRAIAGVKDLRRMTGDDCRLPLPVEPLEILDLLAKTQLELSQAVASGCRERDAPAHARYGSGFVHDDCAASSGTGPCSYLRVDHEADLDIPLRLRQLIVEIAMIVVNY